MSANPEKRKGKAPRFGRASFGRAGSEAPREGDPPPPTGMKRSTKVGLAMAGTAAIAVYLTTREPQCKPPDPNAWNTPETTQPCRSSRSSGSGGRWYWSGGSSNSSSSTTSTTKTSSSSTQGVVSRGGFGATGSSISGHGGS